MHYRKTHAHTHAASGHAHPRGVSRESRMMPLMMGVGPCRMLSSSSTWGSVELRIVPIHKSEPAWQCCCGTQGCCYSGRKEECRKIATWFVGSWSEPNSDSKYQELGLRTAHRTASDISFILHLLQTQDLFLPVFQYSTTTHEHQTVRTNILNLNEGIRDVAHDKTYKQMLCIV